MLSSLVLLLSYQPSFTLPPPLLHPSTHKCIITSFFCFFFTKATASNHDMLFDSGRTKQNLWQALIYLFIYLFIQHLLARPKTANKHERSGDSQPRQAKREKKERCCQRGKGDRERKRKGGTLIIHGITSDETVWKAGL